MLDGWIEDAIECLVEINEEQGRGKINPDDEVAVSNALFSMISSYAFRDEFTGAELRVANSPIQYSHIYLPELNDPYSDDLDIRDEARIRPLNWKFEYPEYWDEDDGPMPEPWERPEDPVYTSHLHPIDCDKTVAILDRLRQKTPYYAKLLETDPEKQIQNLKELDEVRYEYHPDIKYYDLDRMTNMSRYSAGNVDHVFGHRYVGPDGDRRYVVARNWLGPVGVSSLGEGPSKYVLSSISVSPSYRRQGISTNLIRETLKVAMRDQKYIERTSPSEMGDEYTHDYFTELARKEFPSVPFIACKDYQYVHALEKNKEFHDLPYKIKCRAINELVEKIENMVEEAEIKHRTMYPYDYLDLFELQKHADRIWDRCKQEAGLKAEQGSLFEPS